MERPFMKFLPGLKSPAGLAVIPAHGRGRIEIGSKSRVLYNTPVPPYLIPTRNEWKDGKRTTLDA